jgi:hypothetical protein
MPASGEPSSLVTDPVELLTGLLDFFEDVTLRKIEGLSEYQLRHATVPSGWTPLGMVKHLAGVERFWIRHVFIGQHLDFGDPAAEWHVEDTDSRDSIVSFYRDERANTRRALAGASVGAPAQRSILAAGGPPPTLGWVLCHLVQQAARHAGHLDIVRELIDGSVGND